MDNNEDREFKPGFSLIKYGNVLALNFNQEFAQRLNNILVDYTKTDHLSELLTEFTEQIRGELGLPDGKSPYPTDGFDFTRFLHVYSVLLNREFAQELNGVLSRFLLQNKVSPALYSFSKQLETCLYPKKFDKKESYADDY